MSEWISVENKLPEKGGYYLVFCPNYVGGSSTAKESAKGVMFSVYRPKSGWSVETPRNPHCVRYWMPIIMPEGHAQKFVVVCKGDRRFPSLIRFESEEDFLKSTCGDNRSNLKTYSDGRGICWLGGHESMPMYVDKFSRMAYIPICVYEDMTFPCDFELIVIDKHFIYSPLI